MQFIVVGRGGVRSLPLTTNTVVLEYDNWNDHSYVTMFGLDYFDSKGFKHDIGTVKIGFKGQTKSVVTRDKLPPQFPALNPDFFSLGQGVEYYKNIAKLPESVASTILRGLRDIVQNPSIIQDVEDEDVFSTSLLRDYSISLAKGQFRRVLAGLPELTDFRFKFVREAEEPGASFDIPFRVYFEGKPSSNIHAIIGRNGVGKTTLLNDIIDIITKRKQDPATKIIDEEHWKGAEIDEHYFSSLVSVSFSAFDPFEPPEEQPNPAKGTCYFYIGLKEKNGRHKTIDALRNECVRALFDCFRTPSKAQRWRAAIDKLGSDENFARMALTSLHDEFKTLAHTIVFEPDSSNTFERYKAIALEYLNPMSSGHAIVMLTITKLVATVEEKTLVLLDEPESHLHPPLLSAFIRALSELLHDRNGVAITATHSPVVLQEIPHHCAWVVHRDGAFMKKARPSIETFGENVGILTSEVFGLEVANSGFHAVLAREVLEGKSYEQILEEYENRLGVEGRAILQTLIIARQRGAHQ